jgi:hypothetical protein
MTESLPTDKPGPGRNYVKFLTSWAWLLGSTSPHGYHVQAHRAQPPIHTPFIATVRTDHRAISFSRSDLARCPL